LSGCGNLNVTLAREAEGIENGRVYVSPVDRCLLVERTKIRLQPIPLGPTRNSIDRLFESASISHGSNVIAVLLSGMLADVPPVFGTSVSTAAQR
jgi:two-component system chemotaxis response regulator CheB